MVVKSVPAILNYIMSRHVTPEILSKRIWHLIRVVALQIGDCYWYSMGLLQQTVRHAVAGLNFPPRFPHAWEIDLEQSGMHSKLQKSHSTGVIFMIITTD